MRLLSLAVLIQGIFALPDPQAGPPTSASAPPAPPAPTTKPPLRPSDCSNSYYRPQPYGHFINNTIYTPIANESITYPRHVELADGTLLATGSLRGRRTPSAFPIFQSKDGGATWRWISDVEDKVNGWGFGAQPALAELTEPMAGYAAGTILASGNSASSNGTRIDLYASVDKGRSWKFVSRVAQGGRPNTTNGADPIWEPYLLQYKDEGKLKLVAYYSDQRDKLHGQKLAHQVSEDMVNWGPVVNDVAYEQYIARPGMTVVAYIPPIDQWILVHEFPVGNSSSHGVNYPVYYRLAKSPLDFRLSPGLPIVIDGRIAPNASPYVVWSPIGGPNGTIVVSDADNKVVYTNRAGGDVNKWEVHDTPAGATYSRSIHILKDHPDSLLLFGGETFDDMGAHLLTPFTVTSVSLTDILENW